MSFVSGIVIPLVVFFRYLALDETRDPLHGFTQPVDIADDVTRRQSLKSL